MKKLSTLCFSLLFTLLVIGQNISEIQLPIPNRLSLSYIPTFCQNKIFLGARPLNPNGKVLLVAHGYTNAAAIMLIHNGMYERAYAEGYQTAFLSMTRGEGDWVNGEILSRAITQMATRYRVPQVDIIAYSNGGKASEVALFHHKKVNQVGRVVSLGTPFRGTQIADVAGHPPFSWVFEILGLDQGRALSTTYYCETVWRPYFDGLSTQAQSKKYYNYGAWGYKYGKDFAFQALTAITGSIIELNGGGPNDGVTPFYSSTRPKGNQLFLLYTPQGKMNHLDIRRGVYVWDNIRGVLASSTLKNSTLETDLDVVQQVEETPDYSSTSNHQVLSENELTNVLIQDQNATKLNINLIHEVKNANFALVDSNNGTKTLMRSANSLRNNADESSNQISFEMPLRSTLRSSSDASQTSFRIEGDSKFLALAEQDVNNPMNYKLIRKGGKALLEVTFPNLSDDLLNKIQVYAKIYGESGLMGEDIAIKNEINVTFNRSNDTFIFDASSFENGVYSILLTGEVPNVYKRDLVTGFTVGQLRSATISNNSITNMDTNLSEPISVYPTPAEDFVTVEMAENSTFKIFDLNGKQISSGNLDKGTNTINLTEMTSGIYLLITEYDNMQTTTKISIK
ncbi:MAG: hypothetical protein RL662_656 [Bacteroidota bacterium]|jgi:pimeloyl-ACP methyl ester carboxylesterase